MCPNGVICAVELLRARGFLLSPSLSLAAELAYREQCCFCCAEPAVPGIVGWRFVDRDAVNFDHAVVVGGDPKCQGEALVARRGLNIHLVADTSERSEGLGLLDLRTVPVRRVVDGARMLGVVPVLAIQRGEISPPGCHQAAACPPR